MLCAGAGCAGKTNRGIYEQLYPGPRESLERVALIATSGSSLCCLFIESVDGIHYRRRGGTRFSPHGTYEPGYVEVLPGKHRVEVTFISPSTKEVVEKEIDLSTKAGFSYVGSASVTWGGLLTGFSSIEVYFSETRIDPTRFYLE